MVTYDYTGVVEVIGDVQTFQSGFTKRDLVVGNDVDSQNKYPNPVLFTFKKDRCSLVDAVKQGDRVKVPLAYGDYYYVVGFSEKHGGIGSFRLDRIVRQPQILDEDSVQPPEEFDLNVYLNSMFRMYNGERKQIELVCDNSTMDAIIDKFGKDVTVYANDMQSFKAVVTTSLGNVFYSWIFGFGGKVAIKSPQDVRAQYCEMVRKAYESL